MNPIFYLVGGANGAGKTTFALEFSETNGVPYLGADLIAAELCPEDVWSARIPASREFSRRLKGYCERKESVMVESTLSGRSFARHVKTFRKAGFLVLTHFIFLPSEDLHVKRVAARVKKGGHFVPEEDIRRRFIRSAQNFWEIFRPLSDQWFLYENGENPNELIAADTGCGILVREPQTFAKFMDTQKPDDQVKEDGHAYKTREQLELEIFGLRHALDCLIIGQRAVRKARAENTRLGIPNWSYIDGKVVAEP